MQVLRQLPVFSDPRLIVGGETADDAGVFVLNEETALVLTVDVLTPVAEDPYVFGQIAAANALSDVYAMGGSPIAALCIVGFPVGEVSNDTIRAMLAGVWDKVREAGAVIAGGHTTKDPELKCGLAVTGVVHPKRAVTNAGAIPGDRLVLTKPIGTGLITTALRSGAAPGAVVAKANEVMVRLNRRAGEAMVEVGVNAATDVTGFGLLGHAWEMAAASRVDIVIESQAVPLLPGVLGLTNLGLFPGGTERNREFIASRAEFAATVPEELRMLLCDAQTSGGLLIAVPSERCRGLLDRLARRGVDGAVVGSVDVGKGRVRVR